MAQPEITLLNNLDVSMVDFTIKVRIIRLWRQPLWKNPSQAHSIEMIFMDEEGNKSHGSVLQRYFIKHEKYLVEKAAIYIRKPSLGAILTKYSYVDNQYKVCLNFESTITKCTNFRGTEYGFSFISFEAILNHVVQSDSTIDVIGYVTTYYNIENCTTKNGKQSIKMNLLIQDLQNRSIYVTLWESYAQQMSDFVSAKEDGGPVIIILQFARLNYYEGKPYVSTGYYVTRLLINEITSFKQLLVGRDGDNASSSYQLIGSSKVSINDDFLNKTVFNTISEVNEIVQVQSVIVVGTIKCVIKEIEWYYNACSSCNKKVTTKYTTIPKSDGSDEFEEKQTLECTNERCKQANVSAVPRFKLPLRVQDTTGVLSITLFDRDAKKLLNKTAKELLDKMLDGDNLNVYPDDFDDLLGRKYAFKVDISKFNIDQNYKFFTVSKFTADSDIIPI